MLYVNSHDSLPGTGDQVQPGAGHGGEEGAGHGPEGPAAARADGGGAERLHGPLRLLPLALLPQDGAAAAHDARLGPVCQVLRDEGGWLIGDLVQYSARRVKVDGFLDCSDSISKEVHLSFYED